MAAVVATYVAVRTALMRRPRSDEPAEPSAVSKEASEAGPQADLSTIGEPQQPLSPRRRRLLAGMAVAAGGIGAGVLGVPVVGFLLAPLLREERDEWRLLGPVSAFTIGKTVKVEFRDPSPEAWSGPAARSAAWLRREGTEEFIAFKVNCTHLGCPVRWEEGPQFFMCPCHGGVFYRDGEVAAGPPRSALDRYEVRVRDGQVELRTGPIPITGDILPE